MKQLSSKQLLHFFARMADPLQGEVIEKSFERYYLLISRNKENLNRSILYHQALIFILQAHYDLLHLGSAKNHSRELSSLEAKNKLQHKMIAHTPKKSAKKGKKLLYQYASDIYRMKEQEKQSYAQICQYLATHRKLKIDRTYLCKVYPKIKQKIEDLKAMNREKNSIL